MTPIGQYKREVSKKLYCRNRMHRELMDKFDLALSTFLEDNPQPTYPELCYALGTPEIMSQLLMENVSPDEPAHFRKKRHAAWGCISVTVSLLLILSAALLFWKSEPIITYEDCYISEAS